MRVAYRPTFSQFVDNYLATHYSGGVRTLSRLAGGPSLLLGGALVIVAARAWIGSVVLSVLVSVLGVLLLLGGALYTFQPLFNIFLVWLRRDELFGEGREATVIELRRGNLFVKENGEKVKLPLEQIQSIQHRAESTWILTQGDYLIAVPRHGLLEGDHDGFVAALEAAVQPPEEEE